MPGPQPPTVPVSEAERQELLTLIRPIKRHSTSVSGHKSSCYWPTVSMRPPWPTAWGPAAERCGYGDGTGSRAMAVRCTSAYKTPRARVPQPPLAPNSGARSSL
jgi:hypothetical protein